MTYSDFTQRFEFNADTDQLGEGSFGRVYKAWDYLHQENVALKIMPAANEKQDFRLSDEFQIAGTLLHGNIARYNTFFSVEGPREESVSVIQMKYYEHGTLLQLLRKQRLDPSQKDYLLRQLLAGLDYLHSRQPTLIHRDLKPDNILIISHAGQFIPLISDFGISWQVGSMQRYDVIDKTFLADFRIPELDRTVRFITDFNGTTQDNILRPNADLWSYGLLAAYVWLNGHLPFCADDADSAPPDDRSVRILPHIGSLPEPWPEIIGSCLVTNPKQRIGSCQDIRALLAQATDTTIDKLRVGRVVYYGDFDELLYNTSVGRHGETLFYGYNGEPLAQAPTLTPGYKPFKQSNHCATDMKTQI